MKHSVYERDKLGNKEQIESAVSGNIKADLSPNRDTECCGDTEQHTWSLAWILSAVSLLSKMCLVSSGQNITMSSVHRLYRMEWKQYGDPDTEIAAKLLSTSLLFPMFFSLPPDWLALIMRCTLNRSENQRWLYKSGDRIKFWVKSLTHWSVIFKSEFHLSGKNALAWKNPICYLNVAWLLMRLSVVGLRNIQSWRKQ